MVARNAGTAGAKATKLNPLTMSTQEVVEALDSNALKFSDLPGKVATAVAGYVRRAEKAVLNGEIMEATLEETEQDGVYIGTIKVRCVRHSRPANDFVADPKGKSNNRGTRGNWVPSATRTKHQLVQAKGDWALPDGTVIPLTVFSGQTENPDDGEEGEK